MSLFKQIINLWRAEDLLSQAWKDSFEMLQLSREMYVQAVRCLREGGNLKTLIALKKRDREINIFQRDVRRKVMTHYSVSGDISDLASGLVLVNMVVDIERLGDFVKNIVDLAINRPNGLVSENISEDLNHIEREVTERFEKTIEAIHTQDSEVAQSLLKTYKEDITRLADGMVNGIVSGRISFGTEDLTASVALYVRYLKRIGAHLKNITTTLVNPFQSIGYMK